MPIFEFKCVECEEFFEILVMKNNDEDEVKCPKCGKSNFERVMSTMNYSMASSAGAPGSGPSKGVSVQERACSGGSCSTYEIAGHSKE